MKYNKEHTTQTKSKISTPITTAHVPDCSLLLTLHQHYCQLISKVFLQKSYQLVATYSYSKTSQKRHKNIAVLLRLSDVERY